MYRGGGAALENAQGAKAVRLYLEPTTAHHGGAVEMARAEVAGGAGPEAVERAEDIVTAQESEAAKVKKMLERFRTVL